MSDEKEMKEEVKKETEIKNKDPKKEIKKENKVKADEKKEVKKESKKNNKNDKKEKNANSKEKVNQKENKKENKKDKKANKTKSDNKEEKKKQEKNIKNNVDEEVKKDDLTFRKVEIKPEKKNKHRLLKFILTIIIILIGAYCVFFSRNFIILNNIYNQMCEIGSTSNYSYEAIKKENGEEVSKIKYYKKDNVERVDFEDKNQKVNTITDLEENQVTTWYPEEKTASIYTTDTIMKTSLPLDDDINYQESRAFLGLTSIIYTEECNSKECYVIMQIFGPNMMNYSKKTWIDKETGLVVKREYLNSTVEYDNVQTNNVKNIDVPDLRTYKVEKED